DRLGHGTANEYNPNGRLIETDAADGAKTTYTYDAAGHMLTTTDPIGRVTSFTYDVADHLASVTDGGGNTTRQLVNATSGLVISVTKANGATTTYTYD